MGGTIIRSLPMLGLRSSIFRDLSERNNFAVQRSDALAWARQRRPVAVLGAKITIPVDPLEGQPWRPRTHVAEEALDAAFAVLAESHLVQIAMPLAP